MVDFKVSLFYLLTNKILCSQITENWNLQWLLHKYKHNSMCSLRQTQQKRFKVSRTMLSEERRGLILNAVYPEGQVSYDKSGVSKVCYFFVSGHFECCNDNRVYCILCS